MHEIAPREAEQIVKADLPLAEAEANVAYLREMLKGQDNARDNARDGGKDKLRNKDNSRPGRSSRNIPVAELNQPD